MLSYVSFARNRGRTIRRFSLSPKRDAYMDAGEPYGKNRKAMKRYLRDVKSGEYFDERDAWLCVCGNFNTDGLHCNCGAEPPWGCPCSGCQEGDDPRFDEGFYFDDDFPDSSFDDDDDFDDADECGRGLDYEGCTLAGTEFCDFECPLRDS